MLGESKYKIHSFGHTKGIGFKSHGKKGIAVTRKDQCSICERETDQGLYLLKIYICEACESEIKDTPADDPKYMHFVKKMAEAQKSMILS
ncbi:hypothetical protein GLW04_18885 [Halobacillus litoralis]|uniref:Sigma factor G inhibitor Gin n=1 Tax=Halobacillus litoralis TaxID=45668 RepID=A0A845E8G9_9BACI|nr:MULTISPECIES: sigma factor G inhibitor Gin [Halobacillus]MYL21944.1 hypothetical protein [Halobacillus litoralis]MYL31910.1 hypothetical protein [Halobacillus halophilus]MYL39744.1 hypothetical protein [Halobacillus litoralis]